MRCASRLRGGSGLSGQAGLVVVGVSDMGAEIERAMRSAEGLMAKQLTADTDDIERDARTADPSGPPAEL
jgi:hypothetical protein